ncbi:MAG: hypothetical protein KC505_06435 [Myxococcales bacterium]|nr:hypothetical protein [Myxococcales bacterium]USN51380.1 MAG: TldE/PmbA family protein [Myxococcales bacterium]
MKNYFYDVIGILEKKILPQEKYTLWFSGEVLDYARFNHAQIRQAGTTYQQNITLSLIVDEKHLSMTFGLTKNLNVDTVCIGNALKHLRELIIFSSPDPYLMLNDKACSSEVIGSHKVEDKFSVVSQVLDQAAGLDLVGSYVGGPIYKGFANSFGQRNWFESASFIVDTSVYHSGDKAIKQSYSDTTFNHEIFQQKMNQAREGLELFQKPSLSIKPQEYRVYFAPSAVYEILCMMNWQGFSRKALELKSSLLTLLAEGKKNLSEMFSLYENTKEGVGPNFQANGFIKQDKLAIIENGTLKNSLISPKTAREYKLDHNGADDGESMCSIEMLPGNLSESDILPTLGDGLVINNLWYLNFSDKQNGYLTGMTRFLCYAVKNGKAEAPFSVMRFDDSIYRIFGENLLGISQMREKIIDNTTYEERATSWAKVPGVLVDKLRLTL